MNWDGLDFLVAGTMLAILATGGVLALRPKQHWAARLGGLGLLVGNLALFWVNGAVGIIGASNNDANFLYLAVPVIGLAGAGLQRVHRQGLALSGLVSAGAMLVIAAEALIGGWGREAHAWPTDVLVITAVLVGAFLASAGLLRLAGRPQAAPSLSR